MQPNRALGYQRENRNSSKVTESESHVQRGTVTLISVPAMRHCAMRLCVAILASNTRTFSLIRALR